MAHLQVLAHEQRALLARPAPRLGLAARQVRFRKAAQPQQFQELGRAREAKLGGRKRMQAQQMVAALQ